MCAVARRSEGISGSVKRQDCYITYHREVDRAWPHVAHSCSAIAIARTSMSVLRVDSAICRQRAISELHWHEMSRGSRVLCRVTSVHDDLRWRESGVVEKATSNSAMSSSIVTMLLVRTKRKVLQLVVRVVAGRLEMHPALISAARVASMVLDTP